DPLQKNLAKLNIRADFEHGNTIRSGNASDAQSYPQLRQTISICSDHVARSRRYTLQAIEIV
ncbi:MAG TPA: hypothetical protein VKB16_06025, partial [Beijerinckiaceae bacterium]|nr:hypothetical protein [Beijerinckiaceae bacterium]